MASVGDSLLRLSSLHRIFLDVSENNPATENTLNSVRLVCLVCRMAMSKVSTTCFVLLRPFCEGRGGWFCRDSAPVCPPPLVLVGVPCKDAGGWAACIEQTCLTQTLLCTRLPALCHWRRRPTPRRAASTGAVIGRHLSRTPIRISLRTVQGTTHTHTHPFNGPFSWTTRVGRYQKGKTNLDFTEARDSEWQ